MRSSECFRSNSLPASSTACPSLIKFSNVNPTCSTSFSCHSGTTITNHSCMDPIMSSPSQSIRSSAPAGFKDITDRLFERDGALIDPVDTTILYNIIEAFLGQNRGNLYRLNCSNQKTVRVATYQLKMRFMDTYPHLLHRGYAGTHGKSFEHPTYGYTYSSKKALKEEEK